MDTQYYQSTQGKLAFYSWNEQQKTALIFIHGNSQNKNSFKSLSERFLKENCAIYLFDLPGHGESCRLEDYSLLNLAQLISEFINSIKSAKKIVIGHSLGGHLGFEILALAKIDHLIAFGAPPLEIPFNERCFELDTAFSFFFMAEAADEFLINGLSRLGLSPSFCDLYKNYFLETDQTFREKVISSIATGKYANELEYVSNNREKITIVNTLNDPLINLAYLKELGTMYQLRMIDLSAGHYAHIENEDFFFELTKSHLT